MLYNSHLALLDLLVDGLLLPRKQEGQMLVNEVSTSSPPAQMRKLGLTQHC